MAKTRDPAKQARNDVIYAEWLAGASLTDLGVRHHLARQVVTRIVQRRYPQGGEDDDRALFRGYMWRLYDEVQELAEAPGWKMSPQGGVSYGPDGEPALDTNVQVQAKELQLKIIRELRLLEGSDRQQTQRQKAEEAARAEAQAHLAAMADAIAARNAEVEARHRRELEEARRPALPPVVPGEVVRELRPDQQRGEGG